jgi:hypothetical protein
MALSGVLHLADKYYFEGIGSAEAEMGSLAQVCNIHTDDVPSFRLSAYTGIETIPAWSDATVDPTTKTVDSLNTVSVTRSDYAALVKIKWHDALDYPGIVEGALRKLGFTTASTLAGLGWTKAAASFSDTYGGEATALCHDTQVLQTGNLDNKLATAFDRTAAESALAVLRRWKNDTGQTVDGTVGGVIFCGPPELESDAKEVFLANVSSADLAPNVFRDHARGVVITNRLSSSTQWFMLNAMQKPWNLWIRHAPKVTVYAEEHTEQVTLRVSFSAAAFFSPRPDYIVGSAP